jgi:hypothetical protein
MGAPVMTPGGGNSDSKGLLLFLGGILATIALVVGIVLLWPSGDDDDATDVTTADRSTTTAGDTGTTSSDGGPDETTTTETATPPTTAPVDLFTSGAPAVLTDLVMAARNPTQAVEITIYDTYAFLAYRDGREPANIDRRMWRDGEVSSADANPIDDRVDDETTPKLFDIAEVDLAVLPALTQDAPSRFTQDVEVTHVIINRFLPFDDRVLIRVYASPADGRSGGGYVQYTLSGTFVKVIQ